MRAALVVAFLGGVCACQRTRASSADCDAIAEAQTSAELGNYGPPAERAAAIARHRAECGAAGPVAQDCAEVVHRIHQAVQSQIDLVGSDARTMIAKMLPSMRSACEQDGWPDTLKHCVIASKPGDLDALKTCNSLMPAALQEKLQQRMAPKP